MRRIMPLVAPMDMSMAMSRVFSMTSMTSVVMMENEPTSTMSTRITAMAVFSSFSAAKRLAFISIQWRVYSG